MNPQSKIKLLKQVIIISSAFCILVAFLLIANFWQMKSRKPLESQTMEALVKRLADDNNNDELRKEIRNFDLLARKAYFTTSWQVHTGAYLLLFGGLILAIALKIRTDLQREIALPENETVNPLTENNISHKWLLVSGGIVFTLALISALLSTNYLEKYYSGKLVAAETITKTEAIKVIPIVESEGSGIIDSSGISGNTSAEITKKSETSITPEVSAQMAKSVNSGDFKKNQSTFRGYLGQGISFHKNIPTDWDGSSGRNIKWKISLDKPGYNSPVIWGDKIFVAGGDKSSRVVSCFDRNSGRLLWEKVADNIPGSPAIPPKTTDDTGLAAPGMTTDGKYVFAIFGTGDLIAFDLDGNRKWAKNLGVPANHYGHSSSLITWKRNSKPANCWSRCICPPELPTTVLPISSIESGQSIPRWSALASD